ncbi:MAG: hypothetical protein LBO75_01455 [Bifidobacteriaceae bacterium]|jgi:hypothetical protein|nr:hypothetical protein [Bifidobacteriaceae bacterium]
MRTTVELSAYTYERVKLLAETQGRSLSTVIGELTQRSLTESAGEEDGIARDPETGFRFISLGGPIITDQDVAEALEDDQ